MQKTHLMLIRHQGLQSRSGPRNSYGFRKLKFWFSEPEHHVCPQYSTNRFRTIRNDHFTLQMHCRGDRYAIERWFLLTSVQKFGNIIFPNIFFSPGNKTEHEQLAWRVSFAPKAGWRERDGARGASSNTAENWFPLLKNCYRGTRDSTGFIG